MRYDNPLLIPPEGKYRWWGLINDEKLTLPKEGRNFLVNKLDSGSKLEKKNVTKASKEFRRL